MRKRPSKSTKGKARARRLPAASGAPMTPVTTGKATLGYISRGSSAVQAYDQNGVTIGSFRTESAAICAVHDKGESFAPSK
jgi:hypothetical protein